MIPERMHARFAKLADQYEALRRTAEDAVVTWTWADSYLDDPRPLWLERSQLKRGKPLTKAGKLRPGAVEHGFDRTPRVVVMREATAIPNSAYETFIQWGGRIVEIVRFGYASPKIPVQLFELTFAGGLPSRGIYVAQQGEGTEVYHYDAGVLRQIDVAQAQDGVTTRSTVSVELDRYGWPARITQLYENGYSRVILDKTNKKPATNELLAELPQVCERLILQLLSRLRVEGPVSAIGLTYDPEPGATLPPQLGVLTATERDAFRAAHGAQATDYILNPAEWCCYDTPDLALSEPGFQRLCEDLNEYARQSGKSATVVKSIIETCRRLAGRDLGSIVSVTADVIVFATDLEGAQLAANLRSLGIDRPN